MIDGTSLLLSAETSFALFYHGSRSFASLAAGVIGCLALANALHAQTASSERVVVSGEPLPSPTPSDDWKAKLDHIMPEVSGTEITVTKKATVIKLDQQPVVVNNNQQELFTKAPGLLVTEQHDLFVFSYDVQSI
jgi:Fe(3+) dicitrate transport protein